MPIKKGVVAAGHPETAKAAEHVLRDGGNAFDAALAAQFTAFVAEPVLTSPGGGGFLMAETGQGRQILYDFFAQTPIRKKKPSEIRFHPITADFGETRQEYYIGAGSIATPGMVKGLFTIHRDLCTMPIERLVKPAINLARSGVEMNSFQSGIFDIIAPIYRFSDQASKIFKSRLPGCDLIREGEILKQPELADFLDELILNGETFFYEGEIARLISRISKEIGGHLSDEDLLNYRARSRDPLKIGYKSSEISINPAPASGGILIGFGLKLMEQMSDTPVQFGSAKYIDVLAQIQHMTKKVRVDSFVEDVVKDLESKLLDPNLLNQYKKEVLGRLSFARGTTQISIADSKGNLASLTSSNGEGSGIMIPGTGVMLNNMLGEEDLNPGGFHQWWCNERMTSMMAPGIMSMKDGTKIAFGSGGSNRIRTAILQFLINLIDFEMPLDEAVNAPRIHYESTLLNIEYGFRADELRKLTHLYHNRKLWKARNLFFGGAHAVSAGPGGFSGAGDVRRGGVSVLV